MPIKKQIIHQLKKHPKLYNFCTNLVFKRPLIRRLLPYLVKYPIIHVNCVIKYSDLYSFGRAFPRKIPHNLNNPTLFNEKLLWLKYYNYNNNPLCVECFDKYTVRDYVEKSGFPDILNTLYGVWDSVDDIEWDKLPEEYALKKTNGCGHHIFKHKGLSVDIDKEKRMMEKSSKHELMEFRASGDLFATKQKQRYICEKLIESEYGFNQPEDYKFYCFNGKPEYLLYIYDRHDSFVHKTAFLDINLNDKSDFYRGAETCNFIKPSCYEYMLDICKALSKPFPFVRVDFYVQKGKPIFGELTFTPFGSYVLNHVFDNDLNINYKCLQEMGNLLHLDVDDRGCVKG